METTIFHPGNAGLYFYQNQTGILIDGIYDGIHDGMSSMPVQWIEDMRQRRGVFEHVNALIFTHSHPDHFCGQCVQEYLHQCSDNVKLYIGGDFLPWELEEAKNQIHCFSVGNAKLYMKKTQHDGEKFRNDAHESILLKMGKENYFISGDALLTRDDMYLFSGLAGDIDVMFVNVYQAANEKGFTCIRAMNPKRVMLYHLPEKKDDVWNYRRMAKQVIRLAEENGIVLEKLEHMKWVDEKPAVWKEEKKYDLHRIA